MKALLGTLLCLVLGISQSYAIKGGPSYGSSQVSTTGVYAGVLTPGPLSPGANSIGLFSLTIPKTGIGTGTVILFEAGQTYNGTFQGIADPDSAKLTGEIDATFPYTQVIQTGSSNGNPTFTTITVNATAAGKVVGSVVANTNIFSTASARLVGTANIQFSLSVNNPFTQIGYVISGFKQSSI